MTHALAAIAANGRAALAEALDADISPEWAPGGLRLLAHMRRGGWAAAAPARAIVVHRSDERVIGDVRFEPAPLRPAVFELGYSIIPAYRRHGYASEASARILAWLFGEAGAESVIAGCDMRNRASVRTLRRLGFWLDGASGRRAFWWELSRAAFQAQRG